MPNTIAKSLSRLSREKLIELCVSWTQSSKCNPYLASNRSAVETEEEDYLHEPAKSRTELASIYTALGDDQARGELAHLSKKDIIDRIVDGDWRRGLSYHQLASIDFARLEEDDASLRWTALKLIAFDQGQAEAGFTKEHPAKRRRLGESTVRSQTHYPDTTVAIFVQNLKLHVSPLVKAYYHVHRLDSLKLSIVRLHIQPNVPFAPLSTNVPRQGRTTMETSRSMFIALPDSCPYVYISMPGSISLSVPESGLKGPSTKIDLATIKKIILEAIPKAFSRPHQRWSLEPTKLTAKSLRAICLLRGSGSFGTTGGAFSQLMHGVAKPDLQEIPHRKPPTTEDATSNVGAATQFGDREKLVEGRFGHMTGKSHASLDRVHVQVVELNRTSTRNSKKRRRADGEVDQDAAPITFTLSGADVFAGLKHFALAHPEYVDMERLPTALSGGSHCSVITL